VISVHAIVINVSRISVSTTKEERRNLKEGEDPGKHRAEQSWDKLYITIVVF